MSVSLFCDAPRHENGFTDDTSVKLWENSVKSRRDAAGPEVDDLTAAHNQLFQSIIFHVVMWHADSSRCSKVSGIESSTTTSPSCNIHRRSPLRCHQPLRQHPSSCVMERFLPGVVFLFFESTALCDGLFHVRGSVAILVPCLGDAQDPRHLGSLCMTCCVLLRSHPWMVLYVLMGSRVDCEGTMQFEPQLPSCFRRVLRTFVFCPSSFRPTCVFLFLCRFVCVPYFWMDSVELARILAT